MADVSHRDDDGDIAFDSANLSGRGSPEGVVTAAYGSIYRRVDGDPDTTLYVKGGTPGSVDDTGWVPLTSSDDTGDLEDRVTALEAADVALDTRLDTAEADVVALEAADVALAVVDTALDSRLDAIEANNWVTTARILDANVTLAKLANVATDSLIGRDTAGSGVPESITLGSSLSMSGAQVLRRAALTGDVTASVDSNATTIATDAVTTAKIINDAVTYAKMQNVSATSRILGRVTSGAGDVEELTGTQVATIAGAALTGSANAFTGQQRNVPVALSDGANIAVDASTGNVFTVTLGGNRTLDFPSNVVAGMTFTFVITQDGTGSRTLAYGSGYSFGAEGTPTLTTTASRVDIISGFAWSTTKIAMTILKNFS